MRPLRQQLTDAGFEIVLDCAARECGGFDFRFATETLPGPNMYVNIRAFHVVTALRRGADKTPVQAISILASTAATSAYVQIIQAGPEGDAPVVTEPTTDDVIPATLPDASALGARLIAQGHVVLEALDFGTGTSDLGPGPYAPLAELAAMLNADRSLRVALVGHTDAVGALAGNIALSRRRAQSVRQRLIDAYAVDPSRLEAEGMGYLSPVASNLTDAGREQNRRVEVVVLSAD
jgi:OOP family OmpA-OmpF porin